MRLLIDECLHESLVGIAHAEGFEATHVNHLGLSGKPDWELAERIVKDEFTFVTNNRIDFIRLFDETEPHAGLIVIVPNVVPPMAEVGGRSGRTESIWEAADLHYSAVLESCATPAKPFQKSTAQPAH